MANEAGMGVSDRVTVALVTCAPPEPQAEAPKAVFAAPEAETPTQAAREATVAQTGADPPPEG